MNYSNENESDISFFETDATANVVPAALNAKMRTIEVATFVTTERETADNSSLRGYSITSFPGVGRKYYFFKHKE